MVELYRLQGVNAKLEEYRKYRNQIKAWVEQDKEKRHNKRLDRTLYTYTNTPVTEINTGEQPGNINDQPSIIDAQPGSNDEQRSTIGSDSSSGLTMDRDAMEMRSLLSSSIDSWDSEPLRFVLLNNRSTQKPVNIPHNPSSTGPIKRINSEH